MPGSFVEVDTTNGRVRGISYRGASEFLGIPYGASTAGVRRFAPPVAPEKWSGVRNTMSFADAAPQSDVRLSDSGRMLDVRPHMYPKGGHPLDGVRMSENCLVLNVCPATALHRFRAVAAGMSWPFKVRVHPVEEKEERNVCTRILRFTARGTRLSRYRSRWPPSRGS